MSVAMGFTAVAVITVGGLILIVAIAKAMAE